MLDLATLQRQHKEVKQIINNIKIMLNKNDIDKYGLDIATQINILAGKLKIHLSTEDKYMYPYLLQSENETVRKMALDYSDEMGHINEEFVEYKDKFNTRTKIANNTKEFIEETSRVFKILEERMSKEDTSLYIYVG